MNVFFSNGQNCAKISSAVLIRTVERHGEYGKS